MHQQQFVWGELHHARYHVIYAYLLFVLSQHGSHLIRIAYSFDWSISKPGEGSYDCFKPLGDIVSNQLGYLVEGRACLPVGHET